MPNFLEYVDFPRHPLHITFIFNAIFLKNLDGYFFSSDRVSADPYFSEGTRTKRSTYCNKKVGLDSKQFENGRWSTAADQLRNLDKILSLNSN